MGLNVGRPWSGKYSVSAQASSPLDFSILPASVTVVFNSGFPYGSDDGAAWAGRGLTTSAQAGFVARAGPISLTFAPLIFRAENSSFPLTTAGTVCPPSCGRGPGIDLPQRFGSQAYQRFDPGQSTLRVDGFGLAAGISTANEIWGPADRYPFLLSSNGPGFLHVFFGSGHPLNAGIGKVSARVIYGRLEQSEFSPVQGSKYFHSDTDLGRVRFASGLLLVGQPRGLDGLEIGIGRFIHSIWPASGIPRSFLRKPIGAVFKSSTPGIDAQVGGTDNQLLSAFFRWVLPHSGLDFHGEYGREDHNYDFRDLMQEPDHTRAYSLGLRKVFHSTPESFHAIRMEIINFQLPGITRLGRGEGSIYRHGFLQQGHTNRGQLLAADVGDGYGAAAASTLALDRYSAHGRWTVSWDRQVRSELGDFYLTGKVNPKATDVMHTLSVERTRFGETVDMSGFLRIVRDFNRDYRADVNNINAGLTLSLPR